MQEYHFVEDARYAANYLQVHGKRKSQAELKLYLQRKGISREIIREQLEETEHDSGEAIRVLLEKKHYKAGETAPGGKKDHSLSDEAGIFMGRYPERDEGAGGCT